MKTASVGRCDDTAIANVISSIVGRLTKTDREKIEAAESKLASACLNSGNGVQSNAYTERATAIKEVVEGVSEHDKILITVALVDAVLSLPGPEKAAISERVKRALMI